MTMVGPQRHAMDRPNIALATRLFTESTFNSSPARQLPMKNEDNCIEIGYYTHQKSLGEGGFGKVKLATHLKTNQKVAIKMMNKEKLGKDLQRVRIEIEALKVLQHDNIAKLLQVIETKTDIYLILEYCSGGELFDYLISKKRLTESEVRVIMRDLFGVLMFIHDKGFAHRDLKPENILFDGKHTIKLIDFGLAANSSENKSALAFLSTCCGSPAYAAPELLRGNTYSGPAVDVWSAGVLLYSLLVGQLPFDDENIQNLYKKIQIGKYILPTWLTSDVRDLITSMLKTNPAERISVSKVLDHKWIKHGCINAPNLLAKSLIPAAEFDDEALQCCRYIFPELTEEQLRNKIKSFGYHTASYLLLRNNDSGKKFVKESYQRSSANQQPQSFNGANSPRVNAIKRKLGLEIEASSLITPVKKVKEQAPTFVGTPYPNLANTNVAPKPNAASKAVYRPKLMVAIRDPSSSPRTPVTPRLNDKVARRIVSPKMKTNENHFENKIENSPANSPAVCIKSPLREINNHNVLSSPIPPPPKTPVNMNKKPLFKKSTSKKSLLKRIMASATPAKSNVPRKLNVATHSNNITMTSFQEPQECIDRLVDKLTTKGVQCKQKEYGTVFTPSPKSSMFKRLTFVVRKNFTP